MEDAAVIDAKDNALIYIKGREKRKWLVMCAHETYTYGIYVYILTE